MHEAMDDIVKAMKDLQALFPDFRQAQMNGGCQCRQRQNNLIPSA